MKSITGDDKSVEANSELGWRAYSFQLIKSGVFSIKKMDQENGIS